jgi:flagella basal body P-ring formation protein FlgA
MFIIIFIPFLLFAGVIENNITQVYKNYYKNIKISSIILNKNYTKITPKYIDISMINPKRNQGTIKIDNHYIFFKIIATLKVLKSTQPINKGELITKENSTLVNVIFKNFYDKPLTSYTNKSSKLYIPQNRIIYPYMLCNPKLVKKGENITIISKSGGVEISFQATAMQDGQKGDTIKVKKDNKIFSVKIDSQGNGVL